MSAKEILKSLNEIKWALVIVPILAMVISGVISWFALTPVYKASTTLMVFKQSESVVPEYVVPYDVKIGTIMLNQKLVKTYREFANTTFIFEEVITQNKLKMSVDDLRKDINVELLGDTEFLQISVKNSNPTLAAMLANEMARVLIENVALYMNLDNIQVIDAASPPQDTIWPKHYLNVLFAGVIGLLLVLGVSLLRTMKRSGSDEVISEVIQEQGEI